MGSRNVNLCDSASSVNDVKSPSAAPILGTWFGGLLVHIFLCLLWTLGGVAVAGICVVLAGYTYGLSFAIFGCVSLKQERNRQAWSFACLTIFACMGPHDIATPGFITFWLAFVWLCFSVFIAWFWKFQPRKWLPRLFHGLGFGKYYASCELRGALDDMHKDKSLFGFHPHGILSIGFSVNGVWSKQFHEHAGTSTLHLVDKVLRDDNPYFKVLCDIHGCIETLNKERIVNTMAEGRNVSLIPGGFEDATAMIHGGHSTVMKRRAGFIKYALQHGYRVHPIYTFGESDTYFTFTGLLNFRLWLNKFGIPAVAFFGFLGMPLLPRPQAKIMTCVGKAIQLPLIADPSKDEVAKWHQAYCDALVALFDEHKEAAGLEKTAKLSIL